MVLKLCGLVSYELRLNCRDSFCVCYWVFPSDDGRGVEQAYCVVQRPPVGRQLVARCVARKCPAGRQAAGPLRRCLGDVNVSNDVTPFRSVADNITAFGVKTNVSLLMYKPQLLLGGITLLMCRVRLFLPYVSELTILIMMCSLLVAGVE